MKTLPNKPNEALQESHIRKAAILDFIYKLIQENKENPAATAMMELIEKANQVSIED